MVNGGVLKSSMARSQGLLNSLVFRLQTGSLCWPPVPTNSQLDGAQMLAEVSRTTFRVQHKARLL